MCLPAEIQSFIRRYHVLSLAVQDQDGLWAANCFYAFDQTSISLLILSSQQTRHGQAMLQHAHVAGTIAGQPKLIPMIQGLQFSALATRLEGEREEAAYQLYCQRHAIARLHRSTVWRLEMTHAKLTDNKRIFGQKLEWRR